MNNRMNNFQNHSPTNFSRQLADLKAAGANSQPKLPSLASKLLPYNRNRSINNPVYNTKEYSSFTSNMSKNTGTTLARGARFQFQGSNEMVESDQLHSKNSQQKPRMLDTGDSLQNELLKRETKPLPLRSFVSPNFLGSTSKDLFVPRQKYSEFMRDAKRSTSDITKREVKDPPLHISKEPVNKMMQELEDIINFDSASKNKQPLKLQASNSVAAIPKTKTGTSVTPQGFNFLGNDPFAHLELPRFEPSKTSIKKTGNIKAYSANTHHGLVRNYNEDRVAIILNIVKPVNKVAETWPSCSFFGIYDGHGGAKCAEFLRDNLHHFVIRDSNFPANPKSALKYGFASAEKAFTEHALKATPYEKSGSCAIVALIVDSICYIANVGDSRAILSSANGNKFHPLSEDHKPSEEAERKRITEAGGKIYQTQTQIPSMVGIGGQRVLIGPHRVLPGRLSVSRTFGDIEAKLPKFNGNPNVIIAEPDIISFVINSEHDYLILGCFFGFNVGDGIFDKLTSKEALKAIWETTYEGNYNDVHGFCGKAIEALMRESLVKRSLDNITVVMVAFKNLKNGVFKPRNQIPNQNSINQGLNLPNIGTHSGANGRKPNYYTSNADNEFPLIESPLAMENPNEGSYSKLISASDEDSQENLQYSQHFHNKGRII